MGRHQRHVPWGPLKRQIELAYNGRLAQVGDDIFSPPTTFLTEVAEDTGVAHRTLMRAVAAGTLTIQLADRIAVGALNMPAICVYGDEWPDWTDDEEDCA